MPLNIQFGKRCDKSIPRLSAAMFEAGRQNVMIIVKTMLDQNWIRGLASFLAIPV